MGEVHIARSASFGDPRVGQHVPQLGRSGVHKVGLVRRQLLNTSRLTRAPKAFASPPLSSPGLLAINPLARGSQIEISVWSLGIPDPPETLGFNLLTTDQHEGQRFSINIA